jgi:hypothetical protein
MFHAAGPERRFPNRLSLGSHQEWARMTSAGGLSRFGNRRSGLSAPICRLGRGVWAPNTVSRSMENGHWWHLEGGDDDSSLF